MPVLEADLRSTGDLLWLPYQYAYKGLLFGSGTEIIVERADGILSAPEVLDQAPPRPLDHGSYLTPAFYQRRTMDFDMVVNSQAGEIVEEALAEIRKSFQLSHKRQQKEEPLVLWRPGKPKMFCAAKCHRREIPSEFRTARGSPRPSVQLVASDPRFYSLQEQQVSRTVPSGSTQTTFDVHQMGDMEDGAFPIIEIGGPCTNPRIGNAEDENRSIKIDIVVNAGQVLRIDVRNRQITRDGQDVFANRRSDNEWWTLLPGTNTINYQRDSGNTGASSTITVRWRDTWSSA